jgi:hypothetical protein
VVTFEMDESEVDILQPNVFLQEEFAARGMELIDPLDSMRERGASVGPLYGSIDAHLNREGHQALADYLLPIAAETLAKRLESAGAE